MNSIHGLSESVLLVILDGFGINSNSVKNAIKDARTPSLDHILNNYPGTLLDAGGKAVGLPEGIVGNSEVGHMNLGSGRAVRQDLVRINESIAKIPIKHCRNWWHSPKKLRKTMGVFI